MMWGTAIVASILALAFAARAYKLGLPLIGKICFLVAPLPLAINAAAEFMAYIGFPFLLLYSAFGIIVVISYLPRPRHPAQARVETYQRLAISDRDLHS